MFKRWLVAGAALAASVAVSVSLIVLSDPSRGTVEVLAASRDIPSGAVVAPDSIESVRVNQSASLASVLPRRDESAVAGLFTTHDLAAGQLIQRSDLTPAGAVQDRRLVFVRVKDVPPLSTGSKVDLLVISAGRDHAAVRPFALGVEVEASTASGLVLAVPAGKAAAFVYASNALQLAAVIAEPGSTGGVEVPVSTDQEAMDIAGAS